ncbi:MAG: hypothetical protein IID49_03615 [Proteobacteria bacterium]|nr:hypothetical protein [Pseudomonadota bacterium]MCH8951204.1 hypothetical protein [Pseudomonadota bacterium]
MSVFLVGLSLSAAGPACAGAWTQAKGEGLVIVTTGRRVAPVGALTGGPISRDTNISQIYLEYGLFDGLTIGAKSYVELSTIDLEASSAALGGFVRKRVWQDGRGGVASVQLGYAHPIESLLGASFAMAEPGAVPEAHLAGLYGRGWGGDWGTAFLSTGAAYHLRREQTADDLRFEFTTGYAPWRRFMGILSFYGLAPLGAGTDASLKIAPSIAFTMWPWIGRNDKKPRGPVRPSTIQLGVSYDVLNRNDGLGLSISIWRRF